jgi:hypothetical protein
MIYTDRSRMLSYSSCPRERFLNYHCRGRGIVLSKLIISLSTGSAIHKGIELLLLGQPVDLAVSAALLGYETEVKSKELELEQNEDQLFVFNEQKALIEGLIRVYEKIQLPRILSEYNVLAVEKEIEYPLVIHSYIPCNVCLLEYKEISKYNPSCPTCVIFNKHIDKSITLMSKPDAILRDKSTGGLVVYSLKSSSSWTETNEKQNTYDDQGISELVATEYLMKEPVESIKMDFLIKGSRSLYTNPDIVAALSGKPKIKLQNTFLVHPYMCDTGFGNVDIRLDYTKAKGWNRVNIWEEMDIKEWVDMLFEGHYEALEKLIRTPMPYMRDEDDIQDWIEQNTYKEVEIAEKIEKLKVISPELVGAKEATPIYREALNKYFPQNRKSCYSYGRMCTYVDICWHSDKTDELNYEPRVPHHESELKLYQIEKES